MNLGLRIVQIAEMADVRCMKKEKQLSKSFELLYKPLTWTKIVKHIEFLSMEKKDTILIADKPGRMNTKFSNITLHHRLKLCTQRPAHKQ